MIKNVKDNEDMPVGKMQRIEDFLPPPEKLVLPEENVKLTISLSRKSVDFFKKQAKLHHIKYQKMIRRLVDRYVVLYSK